MIIIKIKLIKLGIQKIIQVKLYGFSNLNWFLVCETLTVTLFSPDHRPNSESSTFYRTSLSLPTVLESNLGYFQKVPPLATIGFKAFVVTRQLRRFGFFYFFSAVRLFSKFFKCRQRVPLLIILIFCNQLDKKAQRVFSFAFFGIVRFFRNVFVCLQK